MADISMVVNLGAHALEINVQRSILIASHPTTQEDVITECVQLSEEEAYKLYVSLHGMFTERIAGGVA
jgi:hypothetical protein